MGHFTATIRQRIPEAGGAVTLLLETPEAPGYLAGQFLNIDPHGLPGLAPLAKELETLKGRKERPRAYSLASAPHEPLLAITVKEEPAGEYASLLSPYLIRTAREGDTLPCSGFNGLYVAPADLPPGARLIHLCAGSGLVPNYSIIKSLIQQRPDVRHLLIYANRSLHDALYLRDLTALESSGRLHVVHALSRDPAGDGNQHIHHGRVDGALLSAHQPQADDTWIFACGPSVPAHELRAARLKGEAPSPRFLETMRALLLEMGVRKERLRTEGW